MNYRLVILSMSEYRVNELYCQIRISDELILNPFSEKTM